MIMTNEEWLAAYYPTPASACPKDEAVAHSIRKWEGVAWAAKNEFHIPIRVDASTCALCVHFWDYIPTEDDEDDTPCEECPLALSLGRTCDDDDDDNPKGVQSPWSEYQDNDNPLPMLNALKAIPS